MGKETVQEIDERLQAEEQSPLRQEEEEYCTAGRAALTDAQNALLSDKDCLTIIRGYQTYDPRKEETTKAFVMIAEWREKMDYGKIITQDYPGTKQFHDQWEEKVYGNDKHGHVLLCFRYMGIDTNAIAEYDDDELEQLVGQKLEAYTWLKGVISKKVKQQRYKHTIIVDLGGAGTGLLSGKKRVVVQKVIGIGGDYFPESLWKMYVINTPWALKAMFSVVKPFIHPVTQAKINIIGDPKHALKKMQQNDGFELSAIPDFMGGTHPGKPTYEMLEEAIAATKAAAAAPAAALSSVPSPGSAQALLPAGGGGGGGNGGAAAASAGGVNPFYPTPLGTML